MYTDADAAALYDVLNPWGPSDDFHLRLVLDAPTVLDVGCGTGTLLARARSEGHSGRLAGIDPDAGMLARARRHGGIDWYAAKAADLDFDGEFAHAAMASHAFQFLVTDEEVRASLAAIHRALVPGGRFAFETRNPAVRAWDEWNPANTFDVADHNGLPVRLGYEVLAEKGDVITLTETTSTLDGEVLRADTCDMRFMDAERLDAFLAEAGFAVEARYGDFAGGAYTGTGEDIVTVARR